MNGLQTLATWRDYFDHPNGSLLGVMNAIYPIGKIVGLVATTWVSDRFGRTRPLFLGLILLGIGAALQGAAQNLAMFMVSRCLLGFATSFIGQPSPILITELAYPTHRAKITALYNTFYVRCFPTGVHLAGSWLRH
jgi:MFS family permease